MWCDYFFHNFGRCSLNTGVSLFFLWWPMLLAEALDHPGARLPPRWLLLDVL